LVTMSTPPHREKGFKIHWVDNTHALGIFPCLASGKALQGGTALSPTTGDRGGCWVSRVHWVNGYHV
jgi:hypothetical protein